MVGLLKLIEEDEDDDDQVELEWMVNDPFFGGLL
jgi:hypothetical protein